MIFLLESVDVRPDDTERYLAAFEETYLPGARARGMDLVACWHTPVGIGEDVTVTTIFRMRDWGHWNELRGAAVMDPAMPAWLEIRRELVRGGTRRFYEPAAFSPLS